jgi:hypothetical protein
LFLSSFPEEIEHKPSNQGHKEVPKIGDGFPFSVHGGKDPIPSGFPVCDTLIEVVKAQPDEYRGPHDMVFGYKTPGAAILRMVAVVSHHPVVILLKGIGVCHFTIDHHLVSGNGNAIALIIPDDLFIQGKHF